MSRIRTHHRWSVVALVMLLLLAACRPIPGPIEVGFGGTAYVVPKTADPAHPNEVPVYLFDEQGVPQGSALVAAGQPFEVEALSGPAAGLVSVELDNNDLALGSRRDFWVIPSFVEMRDMIVTVDGVTGPVGDSGLRYHRGTVAGFDDPATPEHDGINLLARKFLSCQSDRWSIGNQTFTTDLVELGVHRNDRSLIDKGVAGLDWGVSVPLNSDGGHKLHRSCDGKTVADYGGSHHSTQWLESLGRAVYLLAGSEYAGEYRAQIETYIDRMEEIATLLTVPANEAYWTSYWLPDSFGNIFTHKAYMRAAALGLTSTLTDDPADAARWAADAASIAQFGMAQQWANGVNPERGGYDVSYQMYGSWLAMIYRSTLADGNPLKPQLTTRINRAITWMDTRIDPVTGQIDIGDSTRTCSAQDGYSQYDAAVAVRVYLSWGHARGNPNLVSRAILMEHGHTSPGNPCPPGTGADVGASTTAEGSVFVADDF